MIYNSEGMLFNQIKKNELLLKDRSQSAWIVGYIARDYLKPSGDPEHPTTDKTINGKYNILQAAAIEAEDLPWEFNSAPQIIGQTSGYRLEIKSGSYKYHISYTYQGKTYSSTSDFTESLTLKYDRLGNYTGFEFQNNHPNVSGGSIARYTAADDFDIYADAKGTLILANDLGDYIKNTDLAIKRVPQSILNEQTVSDATQEQLMSYNGRIVKYANRYYRLLVEIVEDPTVDYSGTDYPILENSLDGFIDSWNADHGNTKPHLARAAKKLVMKAESAGVRVTPVSITTEELNVSIPIQEHRIHLNDAPYDMFAIPYSEIYLTQAGVNCNRDAALAMAFYAAAEMGSGVVYDVQLLPYCPCLDFVNNLGRIDESYGQEGYEYTYIKDTQNNVKSIMIWCSTSNGTIDLAESLEMNRPHYTHTEIDLDRIDEAEYVSFTNKPDRFGPGNIATLTVRDRQFMTRDVRAIDVVMVSGGTTPWRPDWTDMPTLDDELTWTQYKNSGKIVIKYKNSQAPRGESQVSFSFRYQFETYEEIYEYDLATDIKVSDNCDSYRLVSPNYNGIFEFSLAKNGGSVDLFNVDYTYKPHNPYIHVNPKFAGIYG